MKNTVKFVIAFLFNLLVAMSAFAQSSRVVTIQLLCGTPIEFQEYIVDQKQPLFLHGENTVMNSSGTTIKTVLLVTMSITGEYTVAIADSQGAVCLVSRGTNLQPYMAE
jgi:hypothetical protein